MSREIEFVGMHDDDFFETLKSYSNGLINDSNGTLIAEAIAERANDIVRERCIPSFLSKQPPRIEMDREALLRFLVDEYIMPAEEAETLSNLIVRRFSPPQVLDEKYICSACGEEASPLDDDHYLYCKKKSVLNEVELTKIWNELPAPKCYYDFIKIIVQRFSASVPTVEEIAKCDENLDSLTKFTECQHKNDDSIDPECIHCNMAWCIERIKHLQRVSIPTVDEIEKLLTGIKQNAISSYGICTNKDYATAIHLLMSRGNANANPKDG